MKNKINININIFMYIFLYVAISTIFIDYLTYFFNLNYLIELIIGLSVTAIIAYLIRKKIKIINNFSKSDFIFWSILICLLLITIVYPDKMYDSINYHLYNQEYPFYDKVNLDFFPSSFIQSFNYGYADRIFYLFRFIFGYRLGTSLNYFILIILYYQVKDIIKSIFYINGFSNSIISTFSVITLSIVDIMDTYYIDLISLVLLMELFIQVILYSNLDTDKNQNTIKLLFIALLSGLSFACKISNVFFIILLAVVFLLFNYKKFKYIKWYVYLLFVLIFFLPSILYIFNTWKLTGNPVFPFYNTIFKSKYYPNEDWMDNKFGPRRLLEVFIWPLLAFFNSRRAIDISIVEPSLMFGYIVEIILLITFIYKRIVNKEKFNDEAIFLLITIIMNIVWAKFILGYLRYGFIVLVVNNMFFLIYLNKSIRNKKYFISSIMIIMLLYSFGYSFTKYTTYSDFWSYNNYFAYDFDSYKYNLKRLFTKNDTIVSLPDNSAWGVVNSNSGFMKMLNSEIPIIFLRNSTNDAEIKREKLLENIEHIYIISDYLELVNFIPFLNESGYVIKNIQGTYKPSFLNYNNVIYVFEIEKSNAANNHYENFKEFELNVTNKNTIKLYYALDAAYEHINLDNIFFEFKLDDNVIERVPIETGDVSLKYFEYNLNIPKDKFTINIVDANNISIDYINFLILNDEVF